MSILRRNGGGGGMLKIAEISKKAGLPYSTARKYLMLLQEAGFFESKLVDGARMFPPLALPLVMQISRLSSEGLLLAEAVEMLKRGEIEQSPRVQELEKKIDDLSKQVRTLSDLLQIALSQSGKIPELTSQAGVVSRVGGFFKRLYHWLIDKPP